MPKRKSETREERWERKRLKYEKKILECRNEGTPPISCSNENGDTNEDYPEDEHANYEVRLGHSEEGNLDMVEGINEGPDEGPTESTVEALNKSTVEDIDELPMTNEVVIEESIDPELLKALGEYESESDEWGSDIQIEVAVSFQQILQQGLKKELKEELLKKYLVPKNTPYAKAPVLNPELSSMLTESSRNRDKRILTKQDQLGKALSALGTAMTSLLKKEYNKVEVLRNLQDTGKLMADCHYLETETRRSLITPLIDKSLIESFRDRKRYSFLYGENLGDLVKNSRGIKKTSLMIQASAPPTPRTNLNWRGPPPSRQSRFQRASVANQTGMNRNNSGGPKNVYTNRRRAVALPPQPTRRPPAPSTRRLPAPVQKSQQDRPI